MNGRVKPASERALDPIPITPEIEPAIGDDFIAGDAVVYRIRKVCASSRCWPGLRPCAPADHSSFFRFSRSCVATASSSLAILARASLTLGFSSVNWASNSGSNFFNATS